MQYVNARDIRSLRSLKPLVLPIRSHSTAHCSKVHRTFSPRSRPHGFESQTILCKTKADPLIGSAFVLAESMGLTHICCANLSSCARLGRARTRRLHRSLLPFRVLVPCCFFYQIMQKDHPRMVLLHYGGEHGTRTHGAFQPYSLSRRAP